MALDPNIVLAGGGAVPDVGAAFGNALLNVGRFQDLQRQREEQPLRNQLLDLSVRQQEQQEQQRQIELQTAQRNKLVTDNALIASRINSGILAGDFAGVGADMEREAIKREAAGDMAGAADIREDIPHLQTPEGRQRLAAGSQRIVQDAQRLGVFGDLTPSKDARTALQKNLEAAGVKPGTPEYREAVLASINKPSTAITIGDKGISKEQEALATGRVKQLTTFRDEREAAIDTNQSLDVLENIDVSTGALEPAKQGIASFGKAFGIDTSGLANVSAGEGFNAEAKRIVLAVKASQKGPQTDKDEYTIKSTVANLGNTKEGNQFVIDSARALNNRRIERANFFDLFLEENETLKGANREWAKFKRNTPMVSPVMRTPQGLPVFFYKFDQAVRSANPDATKSEILEAWRQANKRGAK